MNFPKIDIVIPVYNAASTLKRAVLSVLKQPELGILWLVDDGSEDQSLALMKELRDYYPHKIRLEILPCNGGVARARNWGALQSQAELIGFLDADDAYEQGALEVASSIFYFRPEISLVRLALKPIGISPRYIEQENFDFAWQHMRMTCGGNMVFRRSFFLACGGFPQHELFRELGGEDGALSIATTKISAVATCFNDVGVLHYCREGMHAERLLDAILFQHHSQEITDEKIAQANQITESICEQIETLKTQLNSPTGIFPMTIERS